MYNKILKIAMLAAHGGSNSNVIPLGGGAAVCERLLQIWSEIPDLEITLIAPGNINSSESKITKIDTHEASENSNDEDEQPLYPTASSEAIPYSSQIISSSTPGHPRATVKLIRVPVLKKNENPTNLSTFRYAQFCREFEQASTSLALKLKPDVILTHDISEGPSFVRLHKSSIPCIPIFHVDVADFFCRMYLKEYVSAKQCERLYSKIRLLPIIPDVLRLVFDKQYDAVKTCPKLIVPSEGMKEIMLSTYGNKNQLSERIEVVPWGSPIPQYGEKDVLDTIPQINNEFGLQEDTPVIVMLSRISPEKAQDKMLDALSWGEQFGEIPAGLTVIICGEASFMQGKTFFKQLKSKASKLHTVRVLFPGHVGGLKKAAVLARADIFVSTSKHESYGLTTMEAMFNGTPAVALETPGSKQTIKPQTGIIVDKEPENIPKLWEAIKSLLTDPEARHDMGKAAKAYAQEETFLKASESILNLLRQVSKKQSENDI